MIPVLHGVWAAAGGLVGDFEHIETITVGAGGASSITFSSIPATYKHLHVRALVSGSIGASATMRFNGDTTSSNYRQHALYGNTAAVYSNTSANALYGPYNIGGAVNASPAAFIMDIADYTSTSKYKTVRYLDGYVANASSGFIELISGLWMSTSAITSIAFTYSTFNQHTTYALYGVK